MPFSTRAFGPHELVLLFDGVFTTSTDSLVHIDGPEARRRVVDGWGGKDISFDVNHFAIRGPNGLLLVDAGTGTEWGPNLGRAREAMAEAGIAPADVDKILLTHLHFDHAQGLLIGREAYFPRAEILVPEADLAFYTDTAARDALPEARRGAFKLTGHILEAYGDRVRAIPNGDVLPGIETFPLPGHTPGQTGFVLRHGDEGVLFWGDALHMQVAQAKDPKIGMVFDIDQAQAARTRKNALEVVAEKGWLIGGAHLSGFASVRRVGDAFEIYTDGWTRRRS